MCWRTSSRARSSGPWSLDLRDDEIADLAYDGVPVLRSIRAVVRDRDWAAAALVVDRVRETDATLTLHVRSQGLGSSFAGVVRVEARADGLVVLCDLESADEFWTNRTGLVVLHPPQTAGAAVEVTHSDGERVASTLPVEISPHQPVFDIAALAWEHGGLAVSVAFAGDVFEMEDQRNWTDASFKTYSRPLALPFPYRVAPGERVRQSITVRAEHVDAAPAASADRDVITLSPAGAFPEVAVGASTAPDPAPADWTPVTDTVLVELDLASTNWRAALARAAASGLRLDVRLTLDARRPEAVAEAAEALSGLPVVRVAAFQPAGHPAEHVTDAAAASALRAALADAGLNVPVIGGARSHFTELNREADRVPGDLDAIAVAMTPLFHARGTEQLIESIAMQRLVARQTVAFAAGRPVHVGPVCLRPRFNNVATGPQPGPTRDDLSEGYGAAFTGAADPRQSAPELAAWVIASAAALGVPGVASLAYFEEWGPRGIHSDDGAAYAAAAAVAALAALSGAELLTGDSPDGLVWAIGAFRDDRTTVLLANLDERPRRIVAHTPHGTAEAVVASFSHAAISLTA
ncbi:hypothetical protein [Microbacterium hominis]|uniref:Uncharacterized protein n=1 Tax=Microbacterium hominis TaxID=162426 RepID=A0A7D4PNX5_9MICO|nr:hypothetical protein [Microbacterium hominis]QKJ20635.1 hypothetical protein HQM25_15615 [Microbacterium hominis]